MRNQIGDERLGDIIIPGTHDSGTWGINNVSYLVERSLLYVIGDQMMPDILADWAMTQPNDFRSQLDAGFRILDLRVADMDTIENGTFRWWHTITGDKIEAGLDQIKQFAIAHPEEVIILDFTHLVAPGNIVEPTFSIPNHRKDHLADLILEKLGSQMVPKLGLCNNPTMNEVLATNASIVAVMEDDYIRTKDDRFWPVIVVSEWTGCSDPESLFLERSRKLQQFRKDYSNKITHISACGTPSTNTIIAATLRVYRNTSKLREVFKILGLNISEIDVNRMSFEGLFFDLLDAAKVGINTAGMRARPAKFYSSGASVHYGGTNEMLHFWLARPNIYRVNTIDADDFPSSTFVATAIEANCGNIVREVTVAFQGNSQDGYYTWNGYQTEGGTSAFNCSVVLARYQLISQQFSLDGLWVELTSKTKISFQKGYYPRDTDFLLQVTSSGLGNWMTIYRNNVHNMITANEDLYLRGTDLDNLHGFAYASLEYNVFGKSGDCHNIPTSDYLNLVMW